jgi:hypothetical protein
VEDVSESYHGGDEEPAGRCRPLFEQREAMLNLHDQYSRECGTHSRRESFCWHVQGENILMTTLIITFLLGEGPESKRENIF